MKTKRLDSCPKTGALGGAIAYLKVEKPCFLFLKGSTGAVVEAGVTTAALPDASAACAGASATRAAPSVDRLVAGASAPAPGACSSATSAALGEGGAGSHLSGGPAPVAFFLFSLSRRRVLRGHRGREPLLLAQPVFLVPLFPALLPPEPSLLLACRPPLLRSLRHARAGSGRGRVGPHDVHGHPLLGRAKCQNCSGASRRNKRKGEPTHQRGVRKHNRRPKVVVAVRDGLKADGVPRPRGRILQGEAVVQQPRARQRHRLVVSPIS
jgi:hypothetical protein